MSVADQVAKAPVCPICGSIMVKRNSARGPFWGCGEFPNCRGTRPGDVDTQSKASKTTDYEPILKMKGSDEQEAIFKAMSNGKTHIVVNAGPGTGKSWTMIQGALRLPKDVKARYMAFNKHINKEISGKLAASGCRNVVSSTFHGFGYGILRKRFKNIGDPNENKMTEILEHLSPEPLYAKSQWRKNLNLTNKIVNLIKNYLMDYTDPDFPNEIEDLLDYHGVEFHNGVVYSQSGSANTVGSLPDALNLIPEAMNMCLDSAATNFDYNDMLWLPVVLDLEFDQYDLLITDESQDLNILQHTMALKAGASGRIVVVGDKHQSIYGFRGASTESMEILTDTLRKTAKGVTEFPLTITRRCPKTHVWMAQTLFPEIQPLDDAPMGEILTMKPELASAAMKIGDLVLCRVNKELISEAYKLIRRGVRPSIKGRDIGKGLMTLLDSLMNKCANENKIRTNTYFKESLPISLQVIAAQLDAYRIEEEMKLAPLGEKAAGRIETLRDKCACLMEFITNSTSVEEMRQRINYLFSDDEKSANVVTLGTVHRTKGLEAERVFVLRPDLIPHPASKKDWEMLQEKNLAWVASTRAKFDNATGAPGTIIFCGSIPSIYGA